MSIGCRSDPLLREILAASLSLRADLIEDDDDEGWAEEWEARAVPREVAVAGLRRLEFANLLGARYELRGYHAMLVYFALEFWISEHNANVEEHGRARHVGPFRVAGIDFNSVVDAVLDDLDFLESADQLSDPVLKPLMGWDNAAWSIANGLPPHPDELELHECPEETFWDDRVLHYVEGADFPAACASPEDALGCADACYWDFQRKGT